MVTTPRTIVYDFSVEPQQQILIGDASRIWVQFMIPTLGVVGIDYSQQLQFFENAFVINGPDALVLTKGDIGSCIGAPMYATSGNPSPFFLFVTEILLLG